MTSPAAELDSEPDTAAQRDADAALNRLIAAGYRFVHPRDAQGEIVAVVGVRAHDTVIDVVRIDGEDEVTATRMPGNEDDVLQPSEPLWQQVGMLSEVVSLLLALADDDHATTQVERSTGCWLSTSPGRNAFLLAS